MAPKTTLYLFLLATSLLCATSARLLDQLVPQLPAVFPPFQTLPSGQLPATPGPDPPLPLVADVAPVNIPIGADVAPITIPDNDDVAPVPVPVGADVAPVHVPAGADVAQVTVPASTDVAPIAIPAGADVAPVALPQDDPPLLDIPPVTTTAIPAPVSATSAPAGPVAVGATVAVPEQPTMSFFMHDILGGSRPSARVVTGIIANSDVNGIPFSKTNNNFFPVNGGVPLANNNLKGIITTNNLPYLAGLNGAQQTSPTVLQNSANSNAVTGGGNQPFVTAGQLPAGATLQKLMFGSTTVFDDELTGGHELGSGVVGRAQGFYLASSLDGTSQTLALTAILHGGDHVDDTISFFGVHRTAARGSQVAVIGGTGKYEDATGYATIQSLHQEDQHTTDGTDTILEFSVYLF